MTTKHTPGPWTLGNENNSSAEVCAGKTVICLDRVERPGFSDEHVISREEMLANVHLVMAAPDLLMTLEHLVEVMDEIGAPPEVTAALTDARIALKRARGEP